MASEHRQRKPVSAQSSLWLRRWGGRAGVKGREEFAEYWSRTPSRNRGRYPRMGSTPHRVWAEMAATAGQSEAGSYARSMRGFQSADGILGSVCCQYLFGEYTGVVFDDRLEGHSRRTWSTVSVVDALCALIGAAAVNVAHRMNVRR